MSAPRLEFAALFIAALLLFGARYGRSGWALAAVERWINGRSVVVLAGVLTTAAVSCVWGTLQPRPLIPDEVSYLLQAKLLASGHWSAPPPPLPEFFEQEHVLVLPRFASKYPPGHALVLTPGVYLGFPALMPLILNGIAGALVFLLARRAANAWVAVLTWIVWLSTSGNLIHRATYLSEVTTSALWLGSWWAALGYHATGRRRWLWLVAALVGMGAITRPLTMLAFALPMSVVLGWQIHKSRRWGALVGAVAIVFGFLTIIPLWSAATTGHWRRTPLAEYTATYIPWDVPGFGLVTTPGTRAGPPDAQGKFRGFMARHQGHQLSSLPRIVLERGIGISEALFGGWRLWLFPIALVGLAGLSRALWVAMLCGAILFLAYLIYAHPPGWVVYYAEAFPLVALLVALGLWRIALVLAVRVRVHRCAAPEAMTRARVGLLMSVALMVPLSIADAAGARAWRSRLIEHRTSFDSSVAQIRDRRAVVFVRHDSAHSTYAGHVENYVGLDTARVWIVHDLGSRNAELRRLVPDRVPYLYDEPSRSLFALP